MPPREIFDYDISVTADKARRARKRGMTGAVDGTARGCEWPGCEEKAAYRAPTSPDRVHEFKWFCLDHVREYNKSWNFFSGWTEEDLEAQMVADRTWERPTWNLKDGRRRPGQSPHANGNAWSRWGFADALDVLGENATLNPGAKDERRRRFKLLTKEEQRAMDTLGLPHEVENRAEVRQRYRELVKDLHPDMNGGNRGDEARLGRVIRAWEILKRSRGFRD